MNSTRSYRRSQQRDEARKKRKTMKTSTSNPKTPAPTPPPPMLKISPRMLNLSYILCTTANLVIIMSTIIFPLMRGEELIPQNMFQTAGTFNGVLFQLITLVVVNALLYIMMKKSYRTKSANIILTSGILAAGILLIQLKYF